MSSRIRRFKTPPAATIYREYASAYNVNAVDAELLVDKVIKVMHDMILKYKSFELPGVGVVGLRRAKPGGRLVISSERVIGEYPGILAVINQEPGWENAKYLHSVTAEQMEFLKEIMQQTPKNLATLGTDDRLLQNQGLGSDSIPSFKD